MRRRKTYYCGRVSLWGMLLFFLILLFILFICIKITPVIRDTAKMQAKTIATRSINNAVEYALSKSDTRYEHLAVVTRNNSGEVTSIQTDMSKINRISNQITAKILEQTEAMEQQKVNIPLGTLVGSRLFSGRGPQIAFYVVPTGSVETNIKNNFHSVGINQTLHQIMLEIKIGIFGVLPGYSVNTTATSHICLAETVIVGAVPDNFTQIEGVTDDTTGLVADYGANKNNVP